MDLTSTPFQVSIVTASAMLAAVIGLLVALRRGHWLTTLVFSSSFLSMAAFQAGTVAMLNADSPATALVWAAYLARVSALASWLWLSLSVILARPDPWQQIRNSGAYLVLALIGCVGMAWAAGTSYVVRAVHGEHGGAVIELGAMGKIYLMYLVVVMVAVVMNLERMVRVSTASAQRRLRPMFVAILVGILAEMLVVSGGLLFGGLRVSWVAASAAPLFVSGAITALALARHRLSDMSVPVARPVIYYSSVSLTLAGAFLLTMAVLSKLLPVLTPEWKRLVSLGFYVLVGGGGVVLTLSPRANRLVKRFIDRNFYANRYDYRREWERVSGAIQPTARIEDLCAQIDALLRSVFDARHTAVYLRDERGGAGAARRGSQGYKRVHGPEAMPATLAAANPLAAELERRRLPLPIKELARDLDLIPIAVENRQAIQALSAAIVAPLAVGDQLVGMLWLSEKRGDEEYSYEDTEFLGTMARQLAAALWSARLAEQLAETRQLESLNRLSTFVLHDIKNHVSGLSLVVDNARRHLANPEFQRDAMAVVERTVASLRELMEQVAGVARPPALRAETVKMDELLGEAAAAAGLKPGAHDGIQLTVRCRAVPPVRVDRRLVMRLLANLLTNAREALNGSGEIELSARVEEAAGEGPGRLIVVVRDSGRGMSETFVREALFRPFATTKPAGLGIGLAQCRSIVEAHQGDIVVESRPGAGTTFTVSLPAQGGDGGT
ncbi:MAG: hypothetical protein A2W00_04100 [Candidatus Eisenbacteria bacterium RBG_16_71_46]|nr:MAG: hypothetical protein A2W00_04100 [Candidatus Eisenbacteria bacterium RBG_16_71_46]